MESIHEIYMFCFLIKKRHQKFQGSPAEYKFYIFTSSTLAGATGTEEKSGYQSLVDV